MAKATRKARADAWWMKLKEPEIQESFLLAAQSGLAIASGLIAAKYKIPAPSISAMSRFYRWAKTRETQWRIEKAVADKDQIDATLAKIGDMDGTVRSGLAALALDAIASRDPERVTDFVSALTGFMSQKENEKRTGIMERRVKLLEEKAAKADAAEGVANDKTLTPEQKTERFKQIFGLL